MLVGRVIDDELGDDADAARMRRGDEILEFGKRPVIRTDVVISGDVVAIVLPGRRIERQQPDRVDPEALRYSRAWR